MAAASNEHFKAAIYVFIVSMICYTLNVTCVWNVIPFPRHGRLGHRATLLTPPPRTTIGP